MLYGAKRAIAIELIIDYAKKAEYWRERARQIAVLHGEDAAHFAVTNANHFEKQADFWRAHVSVDYAEGM